MLHPSSIALVFGFLPFAAFLAFSFRSHQQRESTWRHVAETLGLTFESGSTVFSTPSIRGTLAGTAVVVDIHSTGSNNNRQTFTRFRAHFAPVGPPVEIKRQGALSFLGRLFGTTDVEIGNPEFDQRVIIDGEHEDAIRAYLTPARQRVILDLLSSQQHVKVSERSLEFLETRNMKQAPELIARLHYLVDAAAILGNPISIDRALTQRADGELKESADSLRTMARSSNPNHVVEELMHEAEALVAPPRRPARPGSVVVSETSSPAAVALDQQSVVADLFNQERASYEVADYFDATYLGSSVTWSGSVQRVREFRYDATFEGHGLRAAVLIERLGDGRLVTNEVTAIVQLDLGAAIDEGDEITFTGELVRLDRIMRNLFVGNARLLA